MIKRNKLKSADNHHLKNARNKEHRNSRSKKSDHYYGNSRYKSNNFNKKKNVINGKSRSNNKNCFTGKSRHNNKDNIINPLNYNTKNEHLRHQFDCNVKNNDFYKKNVENFVDTSKNKISINKSKDKEQTEIIYGRNACCGCFDSFERSKINGFHCRKIYSIYILQSKFDEYYKLCPQEIRPLIQKCNSHDMFVVTHENDKHQGVAIKVSKYRFADIETVIDMMAKNDRKNSEPNNETNICNQNNENEKHNRYNNLCKKDNKKKKNIDEIDDKKIDNNKQKKEKNNNSDTEINEKQLIQDKKTSSIFLLDHVQDPHNVGNIIRSAFCFNIDAIILTERNACGITPAVVRSSAGYSERSLICRVNNTVEALKKLKEAGYLIVGFDSKINTKDTLEDIVNKYNKCVFIFGSEGDGMKNLTKKYCDILIKLPMNPNAESLNVANTATITGWEVMKHNYKNK